MTDPSSTFETPATSNAPRSNDVQLRRPLLWSVRREFWENRSLYIAPFVGALIFMCSFALSTVYLPQKRRAVLLLDEVQQRARIGNAYDEAAGIIGAIALVVGLIYCLDALYGERRDRSILFWKSLPVSDRTAVLAKAAVPLVALPLLAFVTVAVMHVLMLMLSNGVLLLNGMKATTATQLPLLRQWTIFSYGQIAFALWHAPIYAWLLLVSAWAKRVPLLWVALPLMIVAAIEKVTLNSSLFLKYLQYRFLGALDMAFDGSMNRRIDSLSELTPGRFLAAPGLWIGLVLAAVFLAAAIHLRRKREPI